MAFTRPVRVLVVDDVSIVRRLVADALSTDPSLEVVGGASNGRVALEMIPEVQPDVLVLDYEMPEMDGLATLFEVRQSFPGIKVIIFSSYTRQGAKVALDALWLGADDFATKHAVGTLAEAAECVRTELIPKIKAVTARAMGKDPAGDDCSRPAPGTRPNRAGGAAPSRAEILAIGASTGGPRALSMILEALPVDFPIPIVIVQHMSPLFTKSLSERLAATIPLPCAEGRDGVVLTGGSVWVAPGDRHMLVERQGTAATLRISDDPPENSCRPSVDPLFRSVAGAYGASALAVLLSGMGQDGLNGCRHVKSRSGSVLVQDAASSVVWGMPGAVVRAGLADEVLAVDRIAPEILRRVGVGVGPRAME